MANFQIYIIFLGYYHMIRKTNIQGYPMKIADMCVSISIGRHIKDRVFYHNLEPAEFLKSCNFIFKRIKIFIFYILMDKLKELFT